MSCKDSQGLLRLRRETYFFKKYIVPDESAFHWMSASLMGEFTSTTLNDLSLRLKTDKTRLVNKEKNHKFNKLSSNNWEREDKSNLVKLIGW